MLSPTLRTSKQILREVDNILKNSTSASFDRATEGKVDKLLRLVELSQAGDMHNFREVGAAKYSYSDRARQAWNEDTTIDPAAVAFFRGVRRLQY
jgi:hypothetical protein